MRPYEPEWGRLFYAMLTPPRDIIQVLSHNWTLARQRNLREFLIPDQAKGCQRWKYLAFYLANNTTRPLGEEKIREFFKDFWLGRAQPSTLEHAAEYAEFLEKMPKRFKPKP